MLLTDYLTTELNKTIEQYFSAPDVARYAVLKFNLEDFSSTYKFIPSGKCLAIKFSISKHYDPNFPMMQLAFQCSLFKRIFYYSVKSIYFAELKLSSVRCRLNFRNTGSKTKSKVTEQLGNSENNTRVSLKRPPTTLFL